MSLMLVACQGMALFAGAAVQVSLVEHPARLACGSNTRTAVAPFVD